MKTTLFSFLLCFPLFLVAQSVDSAAVQQVDSLFRVSRNLAAKRDFDQALEVIAFAEKIALSRDLGMGPESATYASCCFYNGRLLLMKGDYPESEKWYLKSKLIQENALGKDHPDYAATLNDLANLYRALGQYEKAEPLYRNAIAIREKNPGKEHPSYSGTLNGLANLYLSIGQYDKAEPLYVEAKDLLEKSLGKDHPSYAQILNNLAALYMTMSQYEKAEPLYLDAIAIREKKPGKDHPDYAQSLNNLAILYQDLGEYEKAETLYLEAQDIRKKTLGEDHPDYAQSLNNLALLYWNMGQYKKAEPLYLESKAIREKNLGKDHPDYAASLNNLAILYQETGQYEKAEPLFLEAIDIRKNAVGENNPDYATNLDNLANLYRAMGQYGRAVPIFLEAKTIRENNLGKDHPEYANGLNNLAILYAAMGQQEKAEPLYLEAQAVWEKSMGKDHPDYAQSLNNLALLYQDMGQYEKAERCFSELSVVNKFLLEKASRHLSELELNNYLNKFSSDQDQILSFAQLAGSGKLAQVCYDNSLFYKGFLLQAAGRIRQLALSDAATAEKFNRLKGCQRRLSAQYTQPFAQRDSALVDQLEIQVNNIEKDLARTVAGWDEARRQVQWQEVQQNLKEGEVAIEFVHYPYYGKGQTDSIVYAALLLRAGGREASGPQFVPLFEEKQLYSLLQTAGGRKSGYVNNLYPLADKSARAKNSLYELIWQPLEKGLADAKTIYYSSSGLLHRINLAAIPVSDKESLADRYRLVGLNSTRQLVVPVNVDLAVQDAVLYGGVQYEMDSTAIAATHMDYSNSWLTTRGELALSHTDSMNRGGTWSYLKWTADEVEKVGNILPAAGIQTSIREGYTATEESFKSIGRTGPSPRILHLATHGYFFPDPENDPKSAIRSSQSEELTFKTSDHPMIRSGLILAGGNYAWKTGKPFKPDMEDGILTAYEISQMNLSNTELVVLSACETGLGDIQGNEGVYGLQRAFKIAGAKYLIMSLWQVPDMETQELMTVFYQYWLGDKMSIPDAFREAQKEMKGRHLNPYFWAGFVLVE